MTEPGEAAEQLNVGDLMAFWVETPAAPFQIGLGAALVADRLVDASGTLRLAELRDALARRSQEIPRFRQRVHWGRRGEGRPAWVAATPFDITSHVLAATLPAPGDEQAWLAWCASEAARPLDHAQPLWRCTFVTGRSDGAVGMLLVVHHAVVDGIAGVASLTRLFAEAGSAPQHAAPRKAPVSEPRVERVLRRRDRLTVRVRVLWKGVHELPNVARALRDVAHQLRVRAPRTSWSGQLDSARRLAVVRRPLDDVHAAAQDSAATVNDTVLAAVASGLRTLLLARDERPPVQPMRASMPVAVPGRPANEGRMVIVDLPVTAMTIGERLHLIAEQTRSLKEKGDLTHAEVTNTEWFPMFLSRAMIRWASRQAGTRVNVFVTNVIGPASPLRLDGAELCSVLPISPLSAGVHLGVTVFSYAGELVISLHSDGAIDDLDPLAAAVGEALDSLITTPLASVVA